MSKLIAVRLKPEHIMMLDLFQKKYNLKTRTDAIKRICNKHYANIMHKMGREVKE